MCQGRFNRHAAQPDTWRGSKTHGRSLKRFRTEPKWVPCQARPSVWDWTSQRGAYETTWRKPASMSECSMTATPPTVASSILCSKSTSRRKLGCKTIASYSLRNRLSHHSYSQQPGNGKGSNNTAQEASFTHFTKKVNPWQWNNVPRAKETSLFHSQENSCCYQRLPRNYHWL